MVRILWTDEALKYIAEIYKCLAEKRNNKATKQQSNKTIKQRNNETTKQQSKATTKQSKAIKKESLPNQRETLL